MTDFSVPDVMKCQRCGTLYGFVVRPEVGCCNAPLVATDAGDNGKPVYWHPGCSGGKEDPIVSFQVMNRTSPTDDVEPPHE